METQQEKMNVGPDHTIVIEKKGKEGLGGWLILFQISLYLSIIAVFVTMFFNVIPAFGPDVWQTLTDPSSDLYDPLWKPAIIYEVVANILLIGLLIYLLVLMYKKKRLFPKMAIAFIIISFLVTAIDNALVDQITVFDEYGIEKGPNGNLSRLIYASIWIPYFLRSKRVRNTFVNY